MVGRPLDNSLALAGFMELLCCVWGASAMATKMCCQKLCNHGNRNSFSKSYASIDVSSMNLTNETSISGTDRQPSATGNARLTPEIPLCRPPGNSQVLATHQPVCEVDVGHLLPGLDEVGLVVRH